MISIIVPAYNAEHVITKCLASLRAQSFTDFECIIVDDHSSDATCDAARRTVATDSRFFIVANPRTMGPSHCRNVALRMARGEYIGFVDADDWLDGDALSILMHEMMTRDLDYCFSSHLEYLDSAGTYRKKNPQLHESTVFSPAEALAYIENYLQDPCRYYGLVHCWGRLYRTAIIRDHAIEFDIRLTQMEDVSFNFKYLGHCGKIGFADAYLYVHRIAAGAGLGATKGLETAFDSKLQWAIKPVEDYLADRAGLSHAEIRKRTLHFYASMSIVAILRMARRFFSCPRWQEYMSMRALIRSAITQEAISFYRPGALDSKLLGMAIRWRMASLALGICFLKSTFGWTL